MSRPRAFALCMLCIVASAFALDAVGNWTGLNGGLWPLAWGVPNGIIWSRLYTRLVRR